MILVVTGTFLHVSTVFEELFPGKMSSIGTVIDPYTFEAKIQVNVDINDDELALLKLAL